MNELDKDDVYHLGEMSEQIKNMAEDIKEIKDFVLKNGLLTKVAKHGKALAIQWVILFAIFALVLKDSFK